MKKKKVNEDNSEKKILQKKTQKKLEENHVRKNYINP